jgi:hypothetical protein
MLLSSKSSPSFFISLSSLFIVLAGCTPELDIKNQALRDRVCACSAGFSSDVSASLQMAYDKAALKGGTTADFKNETQAIIFSELPEQDRLKAYEDYIQCIEKDWNIQSSSLTKKYISKAHQNNTKHFGISDP